MKTFNFPVVLHLACLLLLAAAVVGGLWQLGEPLLVILLLVAILPFGLSARLPERWFPKELRSGLQIIMACGAMAWFYWRSRIVPFDLVLVESTAILGLGLTVSGIQREYGLMTLISLLLIGYGGMSPSRAIFLPNIGLYLTTIMFVLYNTRFFHLVGDAPDYSSPLTSATSPLSYTLLHCLVFLSLSIALIVLFPPPQKDIKGLIPVSFETTREMQFPKLFGRWLHSSRFLPGESDQAPMDSGEGEDFVLAENARVKLNVTDPPPEWDAAEGNGNGGRMGTDLVFRVKSSAKLYWLARIYDNYDGKIWTVSTALERQSPFRRSNHTGAYYRKVTQRFSIEKAVSNRLYGAFVPQRYTWMPASGEVRNQQGNVAWEPGKLIGKQKVYGAEITDPDYPLPWTYECVSEVCTPPPAGVVISEEECTACALTEAAFKHNTQLKKGVLSNRVKQLAESIVGDASDDLEKALRLRDYLRENYIYNLEPPLMPEGTDVVDYFLFESKEGYCHHFAEALTVLARSVNLPARVAVGYAPGNYNVLTGYFEVYEYHAHAWSQIYVLPYGWLTLDGVSPGSLRIEATPPVLGKTMDPFGDEWEANPPELSLTAEANPELSVTEAKTLSPAVPNKITRTYNKIHKKTIETSGRSNPTAMDVAWVTLGEFKAWLLRSLDRLKEVFLNWAAGCRDRAMAIGQGIVFYAGQLQKHIYIVLLAVFCGAFVVLQRQSQIMRRIGRWWRKRRCAKYWRQLNTEATVDPKQTVKLCHLLSIELLDWGGYRRPRNLDLLEFAEHLGRKETELGSNLHIISSAFMRDVYGADLLPRTEIDRVLRATRKLRHHLLN